MAQILRYTKSLTELVDGRQDNKLTIEMVLDREPFKDGPGVPRAFLHFEGECRDTTGALARRKFRYDLPPELARKIQLAFQRPWVHERSVPQLPQLPREYIEDIDGRFTAGLRITSKGRFATLSHAKDGWEFEAKDKEEFDSAFGAAAD